MLSEKQIEALKAGVYGITRDGNKVRIIYVLGEIALVAVHKTVWKFESYANFPSYHSFGSNSGLDIVGLWEDHPEPVNLERALAGELIVYKGYTCFVYKSFKGDGSYIVEENINGYVWNSVSEEELRECEMWKEPKRFIPKADLLPKPIKEFGDLTEVWRIIIDYEKNKYIPYKHNKGTGWTDVEKIRLANGCYYATKDDCQAICNWLMNR